MPPQSWSRAKEILDLLLDEDPSLSLQSVERLRRRLQTEPTSVRDEVESLLPYLRTLDSRQGAGIADAAPGLLESIAREAW
jgi:hypothetical protein